MSQESLESGRNFLRAAACRLKRSRSHNKCCKPRRCLCAFSDGDSAQDVSDFNWDDYLEETGALSVPHHAFKHVSARLPSRRSPKRLAKSCDISDGI